MEFINFLLGGLLDLITLIIIIALLPFMRIINSKRINTFIEQILVKIFSEEGLF